jgi:hypothetical protein
VADLLDGEAPHRERLVEVDGLAAADAAADAGGGVERRQRTERKMLLAQDKQADGRLSFAGRGE